MERASFHSSIAWSSSADILVRAKSQRFEAIRFPSHISLKTRNDSWFRACPNSFWSDGDCGIDHVTLKGFHQLTSRTRDDISNGEKMLKFENAAGYFLFSGVLGFPP